MQVALEAFRGRELPEEILLFVRAELALDATDQELVLQPQALFGVRHVREFGADRPAIGVFELRDDLAQLQLRRHFDGTRAGEEFGIEVGFAQTEVRQLEHARTRTLLHAQRIELGDQVTTIGVNLHQARDRALLGGGIGGQRCAGSRGHPRTRGARGDTRDDRGMNLLTRRSIAQLLKILAPPGIDGLGIGEELLVQSFNVRGIAARQRRGSQQLAKACGHTRKKPLDSRSWSGKGAVC